MFGKNHIVNLDMINIFEVFLPQLLRYPNPSDPLNNDAAALLIRDPKSYEIKVKDYVKRYASSLNSEKETFIENATNDSQSSDFEDSEENIAL